MFVGSLLNHFRNKALVAVGSKHAWKLWA